MGRFIGPGYVRVGPITAGPLGIGCLMATLKIAVVGAVLVVVSRLR